MFLFHDKCFTLIELLIVVAIISILSAIAVPNFMEAQVRSKVSRAQADIRSITTAIECYRVDENKYPPCTANLDGWPSLRLLTSPVSYISGAKLQDPFMGITEGVFYDVYGYSSRDEVTIATPENERTPLWYILTSNGPNKLLDDYQTPLDVDYVIGFVDTIYDPTNGTNSRGNIYRAGGGVSGSGAEAGLYIIKAND